MSEQEPLEPSGSGMMLEVGSQLPAAVTKALGEMNADEVLIYKAAYDRNRGNEESWRIGYGIEAVRQFRSQKHS